MHEARPLIVAHRINTLEELANIPREFGVEVDLRDYDGKVILQHDALKGGEPFEEYLNQYRHRFLILNVKCEGVEELVLPLLKSRKIEDFFFLDLSFPALMKLVRTGEHRIAVRFSEYEPAEACLALAGKADWVWIDCFNNYPALDARGEELIRRFKTCLVAPELQGHPPMDQAQAARVAARYRPSAVCTKFPHAWPAAFSDHPRG